MTHASADRDVFGNERCNAGKATLTIDRSSEARNPPSAVTANKRADRPLPDAGAPRQAGRAGLGGRWSSTAPRSGGSASSFDPYIPFSSHRHRDGGSGGQTPPGTGEPGRRTPARAIALRLATQFRPVGLTVGKR